MGTQINTRKMSSEKYELAQDELDTIIERLRGNIKQVEVGHGEAKKRMVQVCFKKIKVRALFSFSKVFRMV